MPRNPRQHAPEPLAVLLDDHAAFDEAFARHQEALLMRNVAGAKAHMERFRGLLIPHLEMEEELLLPIFAARGAAIVGAGPAVFTAEHAKIKRDIAELERRTAELDACAAGACRETLQAVLAVLDREYLFKDYLKHHDLRERNALYPELDRIVGDDERAELWTKIRNKLRVEG